MGESLGGKGGGSMSSLSRVEGNRMLADEAVLRVLLLREDCLVQVPSADIVLWDLEMGEGPVTGGDFREATDDVRERAIDDSRRVRGDGEFSSSLHARSCEYRGKRKSDTADIHIPITPSQPSCEANATAQKSTIPMPCSPFEGITLIFEQAGLCPCRR